MGNYVTFQPSFIHSTYLFLTLSLRQSTCCLHLHYISLLTINCFCHLWLLGVSLSTISIFQHTYTHSESYRLLWGPILEATLTQLPQSTCYNTYGIKQSLPAAALILLFVLTVTLILFNWYFLSSLLPVHKVTFSGWKLVERNQFKLTPLGV